MAPDFSGESRYGKNYFYVKTDKNGFRINHLVDKAESKKSFFGEKIFFIGDSFTFGPYLPNHDTFTAIANRMSEEETSSNKIQFLNAGLNSATIFHEIETLKLSKKLNPDLLISKRM